MGNFYTKSEKCSRIKSLGEDRLIILNKWIEDDQNDLLYFELLNYYILNNKEKDGYEGELDIIAIKSISEDDRKLMLYMMESTIRQIKLEKSLVQTIIYGE